MTVYFTLTYLICKIIFCILNELKWAWLVLFLDAAYRVHKLVLNDRYFKAPKTTVWIPWTAGQIECLDKSDPLRTAYRTGPLLSDRWGGNTVQLLPHQSREFWLHSAQHVLLAPVPTHFLPSFPGSSTTMLTTPGCTCLPTSASLARFQVAEGRQGVDLVHHCLLKLAQWTGHIWGAPTIMCWGKEQISEQIFN